MGTQKSLPTLEIQSADVRLYFDPETGAIESYVVDSVGQGSREEWVALSASEIAANRLSYVIEDTEFGPTVFPTRHHAPRG